MKLTSICKYIQMKTGVLLHYNALILVHDDLFKIGTIENLEAEGVTLTIDRHIHESTNICQCQKLL